MALPMCSLHRYCDPPAPRRARFTGWPALAVCAALATSTFRARGDEPAWPEWRGPGRAGVWSGARLPARLSEATTRRRWSVPLGGGYGGVAVVGERLWTLERPQPKAAEERLVCFDRGSGRRLWEQAWAADYGDMDFPNGPRVTPTVHEGRVYALGATGKLHCLDAASGERRWSLDGEKGIETQRPTWGHAASPLVDEDLLIVVLGARPRGTVLALDRRSGAERWRALGDKLGYSSPLIATLGGRRQLVVWTAEALHGLEPASGALLWSQPCATSNYDVAIISPVIAAERVFVSGYWDGSWCFARRGGAPLDEDAGKVKRRAAETFELAWRAEPVPSCLMSTPLWRDGHLYALDKRDGLLCVEWDSGKVRWKDSEHRITPAGRNPQASLVWAGERAVILNASGELIVAALSPAAFEEQGRVKIIGETWAHPAFAGQQVFARDDKELVCVEVLP